MSPITVAPVVGRNDVTIERKGEGVAGNRPRGNDKRQVYRRHEEYFDVDTIVT